MNPEIAWLRQETDSAKKALEEAEAAQERKSAKWREAQAAGQAADDYAAKKLSKVEDVLHDKMQSLTEAAKAGLVLIPS